MIYKQDYGQLYGGELEVESIISPVEKSFTADRAYAVGSFFILDGKMYEVTQAIAQGDTIVVGTNCQLADTVMEYIESMREGVKTDTFSITAGAALGVASLGVNINDRIIVGLYDSEYHLFFQYVNTNGIQGVYVYEQSGSTFKPVAQGTVITGTYYYIEP